MILPKEIYTISRGNIISFSYNSIQALTNRVEKMWEIVYNDLEI